MTESTEVAVRQPTAVTTGGEVAGLIPQSIEEAYRLATAISKSGMAPKSLDSTEKCLVAIMAGAEIGLPPYQAVQAFAIINGRPTLWGDAFLAVLLSKGFKVEEWFDDPDTPTKAFCKITRPDTGQEVERSFGVEDAKKAKLWEKKGRDGQDTPWITYPSRMLQMRARAFAGRDGAADALKGFGMREEVADYEVIREARPQVSDLRARLEANREPPSEGFTVENGDHVEEVLAEVELPVADTERPGASRTADPAQTLEDAAQPAEAAPEPLGAAETVEERISGFLAGDVDDDSDAEGLEGASDRALADLNARIDAYVAALDAATTKIRLQGTRARAKALLDEVFQQDPQRAEAMDSLFNRRFAEIEGAK